MAYDAARRVSETEGLQDWFKPYVQASLDIHQLVTGGRVDSRGRITGGTRPTVTSTYRSEAKQALLYRERESNPNPVARPGQSPHNFGVAFDADVPDAQMPLWTAVRNYVGLHTQANDPVHAHHPQVWAAIRAQLGI